MMTRSEFEQFLTRFVWRDGDTVLQSDLQYLISMGQTRLSRDLDVQRRIAATAFSATDARLTLPDDYHHLRTLSDGKRALTYVPPHKFEDLRARGYDAPYYTVGDTVEILSSTVSPETPVEIRMTYYTNLPEYVDAPTWVQTHYWDLYLHACLLHTSMFLLDDERLARWEALYDKNLEGARLEDAARTYNGSPLRPSMPGVVA